MNEIIYKIEKDINTIKIIDGKLYFGASGKSKIFTEIDASYNEFSVILPDKNNFFTS